MIPNDIVVLVGDRFSSFALLDGAVSVSKLAAHFDNAPSNDALPSCVVVGQGVSDSWLAYLEARAAERGADVSFVGERRVADRPGRHVCHKWQRRNVVITRPVPAGPNVYEMQLSIDDDCEIMSDHVTGHHVQGMVLVEAARQAFLTVTEAYLLESDEPHYFVIDKLNASFQRFIFPVHVDIRFELQTVDRSRSDRVRAEAVVRFMHCDELACQIDVAYTAIEDRKLSPREEQLARAALQHQLQAHQPRQEAATVS